MTPEVFLAQKLWEFYGEMKEADDNIGLYDSVDGVLKEQGEVVADYVKRIKDIPL